ncbi:uncharacterized protein MELLADRAFT_60034 [Melampsora larici-populina 98AG31]|uniref:Uncharacterized protein n=1 Tax=Melampsora larici-populina (strain 98AG31 / pathotype 3-4-7) TaxID=747676 RepID=F4R9R0_MELLP|nr:uncharacterized protein MELLADRAFT_60034 [Melampsora larici-populina 98AG31]EGG11023.1 hypothetical protein MELLADRAFT_60034 [Melampsora larici-populina 98AG31]
MSCFDAFLDSMYGKEVSRKRPITHVEKSVCVSNATSRANIKRARITQPEIRSSTRSRPEKTMSLEEFVIDMYTGRDMVLKSSPRKVNEPKRYTEGEALKLALELLMSPPPAPRTSINGTSSPTSTYPSVSSSLNPSPTGPQKEKAVYHESLNPVMEPNRSIPLLYLTEPEEDPYWLAEVCEATREDFMDETLLKVPKSQVLSRTPVQPNTW